MTSRGAVGKRVREQAAGALEGGGHLLRLALERGREPDAGLVDLDPDAVARAGEAIDELDAAIGHVLDEAIAGPAERDRHLRRRAPRASS